jgi:hypothetical protein
MDLIGLEVLMKRYGGFSKLAANGIGLGEGGDFNH